MQVHLLMAVDQTVKTTGVNVEALMATVASLVVILGGIIAAIGWALRNANAREIRQVITSDVVPVLESIRGEIHELRQVASDHEARLSHLEGFAKGVAYQCGVENRKQAGGT